MTPIGTRSFLTNTLGSQESISANIEDDSTTETANDTEALLHEVLKLTEEDHFELVSSRRFNLDFGETTGEKIVEPNGIICNWLSAARKRTFKTLCNAIGTLKDPTEDVHFPENLKKRKTTVFDSTAQQTSSIFQRQASYNLNPFQFETLNKTPYEEYSSKPKTGGKISIYSGKSGSTVNCLKNASELMQGNLMLPKQTSDQSCVSRPSIEALDHCSQQHLIIDPVDKQVPFLDGNSEKGTRDDKDIENSEKDNEIEVMEHQNIFLIPETQASQQASNNPWIREPFTPPSQSPHICELLEEDISPYRIPSSKDEICTQIKTTETTMIPNTREEHNNPTTEIAMIPNTIKEHNNPTKQTPTKKKCSHTNSDSVALSSKLKTRPTTKRQTSRVKKPKKADPSPKLPVHKLFKDSPINDREVQAFIVNSILEKHPYLRIPNNITLKLMMFLFDLLQRIGDEAKILLTLSKKKTMDARVLQYAIKLSLDHLKNEGDVVAGKRNHWLF